MRDGAQFIPTQRRQAVERALREILSDAGLEDLGVAETGDDDLAADPKGTAAVIHDPIAPEPPPSLSGKDKRY